MKNWNWKKIITVLIAILSAILGTVWVTGCTAQQMVQQSATSEITKRGDTLVTSTTIRYEQVGKTSK